MADPVERMTNLLALLLETRVPLTLAEIADRLVGLYPDTESARRTSFERDKAVLRAEGVPIEQLVLTGEQAGQTGYWVDRAKYELGDFGLTDEERNALQLAVAAVQLGTDWGEQAIWKLGGSGGAGRQDLEASLPSLPALPVLFEAVADRAAVEFGYRGRARTLEPYSLLARNGLWYLVGRDLEHDEARVYRVDRIEGAITPREPGSFRRPDDFDPRTLVPADFKSKGFGEGEPDAEQASVWVAATRAGGVVRELGESAIERRDTDGSIVVRVPCANPMSFRHWMLELLDDAEIIEPASVRDSFVAYLTEIVGAR